MPVDLHTDHGNQICYTDPLKKHAEAVYLSW